MSIFLAFFSSTEEAHVVTDTRALGSYEPGAASAEMVKALPLPPQSCIIAASGPALALPLFLSHVIARALPGYDEIAEALPEIAPHVQAGASAGQEDERYRDVALLLVGWSAAQGRMAGMVIEDHGQGWRTATAAPGGLLAVPPIDLSTWPGLAAMRARGRVLPRGPAGVGLAADPGASRHETPRRGDRLAGRWRAWRPGRSPGPVAHYLAAR